MFIIISYYVIYNCCRVIRYSTVVGFVIRGKAPQESNIFRNLLADGDRLIEEELMFKSPRI